MVFGWIFSQRGAGGLLVAFLMRILFVLILAIPHTSFGVKERCDQQLLKESTVISGSYRRHLGDILILKRFLEEKGVTVLAPTGTTAVNPGSEFIVLDTDETSDVATLQSAIFDKMRGASFHVLCNRGGYLGTASVVEAGYALASRKVLYTTDPVNDPNLAVFCKPLHEKFPDWPTYRRRGRAIQTIVFDGDDTLWHDQKLLQAAEREIDLLLANELGRPSGFHERFAEVERINIPTLKFGLQSYLINLSQAFRSYPEAMILNEQFIEINRRLVRQVTEEEREPLPHVVSTLKDLRAKGFTLGVLTRGAHFEQLHKLERSGLREYFDFVRVVPEKNEKTYRDLAEQLAVELASLLMVGNSVKSDVVPAVRAGWRAVHVPAEFTWSADDMLEPGHEFQRVDNLSQLSSLIAGDHFMSSSPLAQPIEHIMSQFQVAPPQSPERSP